MSYYEEEIANIPLLPLSGDVQEHAQKLIDRLVSAQKRGKSIIPSRKEYLNSQLKTRASSG